MQKVKIAAPRGKVKGVTFNKTTGGFRCPTPGGYEREYKRLVGVGTWERTKPHHPLGRGEAIPTWGTQQYPATS